MSEKFFFSFPLVRRPPTKASITVYNLLKEKWLSRKTFADIKARIQSFPTIIINAAPSVNEQLINSELSNLLEKSEKVCPVFGNDCEITFWLGVKERQISNKLSEIFKRGTFINDTQNQEVNYLGTSKFLDIPNERIIFSSDDIFQEEIKRYVEAFAKITRRDGHIRLPSGRHVNEFICPKKLIADRDICLRIARQIFSKFNGTSAKYIISDGEPGLTLIQDLKLLFSEDKKSIPTEIIICDYDNPKKDIRKEYKPGEKVLIMITVNSTGGLINRIIKTVGVENVERVVTICDTDNYEGEYPAEKISWLSQYHVEMAKDESECKFCAEGNECRYQVNSRTLEIDSITAEKQGIKNHIPTKKEELALWKMADATKAISFHYTPPGSGRHYIYYIDTLKILDKFAEQIQTE